MPKSYRFRTEVGVDREVRLNIEQDFDTLEVLSLKLRQEDIYSRFCADYGVVAGRVVANGGFGVPNVSVSIFVPLDNIDEDDPVISTLYPYKSLKDKSEDGYRYNLLPYEQENSGHTPTGTFPTRDDVLNRSEVLHIYEKYYKFTVRTNESGDFMIVGVPLGEQKLVVDIDLSNMGKFSLRPDDLIRMGLGVKEQFIGNQFKSSENLDSLPQIINEVYDINVSSFWGEEDICDVGITRIDVDLRDLGVDIQPRSIFMGSVMTTNDDDFIRPNCKPKNKVGKLCNLTTGIGTILALRQGFDKDNTDRPIIEEYKLEDNGYVIDENGTWLIEIPMNLDYITTNEFGEEIISNDPNIGIPTQGKYRFKIGLVQEDVVNNEVLRADYLVPNIKEHGWMTPNTYDRPSEHVMNKSYAFSLDWDDYYDYEAAIRCEDTFYNFYYNKVYTIAGNVDRFKFGRGRQKHTGIKEINDDKCVSEHNSYPVNDAQRNGSLLIILFNYFITIIIPMVVQTIIIVHVLAVVWGIIKFIINLITGILNFIYSILCRAVVIVVNIVTLGFSSLSFDDCNDKLIPKIEGNFFKNIPLPMLTYPDCEMCPCNDPDDVDVESTELLQELNESLEQFPPSGALLITSQSNLELMDKPEAVCSRTAGDGDDDHYDSDVDANNRNHTQAMMALSGYDGRIDKYYKTVYGQASNQDKGAWYKSPVHVRFKDNGKILDWHLQTNPTWSQAINLLNRRSNYFISSNPLMNYGKFAREEQGGTAIKVQYINDQFGESNSEPIYDNVLVFLTRQKMEPGELFTFNDPFMVNDNNVGKIGFFEYNENGYVNKTIKGIDPFGNEYESTVQLYSPTQEARYRFTAGVEYFQPIYSEKVSTIRNTINYGNDCVFEQAFIRWPVEHGGCGGSVNNKDFGDVEVDDHPNDSFWPWVWSNDEPQNKVRSQVDNFYNIDKAYVNIVVRGVDPNSPKQKIKYDLSRFFKQPSIVPSGLSDAFPGYFTVQGEFFMNVPIQSNNPGNTGNELDDIASNGGTWRRNQYTPVPHYRYLGTENGDFSNATNENETTVMYANGGDNVWSSIKTPNLWNQSYLFNFEFDADGYDTNSDDAQSWDGFLTGAPTKYVSLDKSLLDPRHGYGNDSGDENDIPQYGELYDDLKDKYVRNDDQGNHFFDLGPDADPDGTNARIRAGIPDLPIGNWGMSGSNGYTNWSFPQDDQVIYKQRYVAGVGFQYSKINGGGNQANQIDNGSNPERNVISISPLYLNNDANLADVFDLDGLQPKTTMSNSKNIVFRSDRLPAGDYWDEPAKNELGNSTEESTIFYRRYVLQMSVTQTMFGISTDGQSTSLGGVAYGINISYPDQSGESADFQDDVEDYGLDSGVAQASNILSSFTCDNMAPLTCYEGSGEDFEVLLGDECETNPLLNMTAGERLRGGCYLLVTSKLLVSIPADIAHFFEWRLRMRFMFAVCQGVIGETFNNNWVNGNLYMPSFKKKSIYGFAVSQNEVVSVSFNGNTSDTFSFDYAGSARLLEGDYDNINIEYEIFINGDSVGENISGFPFEPDDNIYIVIQSPLDLPIGFFLSFDVVRYPRYKYCGDPKQPERIRYKGPLHFNTSTNTFYYRSTPYDSVEEKFVGQLDIDNGNPRPRYPGTNRKNIWFPTTIADLGPKNEFAYEVTFDDEFESYVMDKLRTTTYGNNDAITNLFLISRLRNAGFFQSLLGLGDGSIGQLFSRETGNDRFYDARVDGDYAQMVSIGSELGAEPVVEGAYFDDELFLDGDNIGVYYNSDTILRRKLSGVAHTYGDDPENSTYYLREPVRDQVVPYYKWKVEPDSEGEPSNVFGSEFNNWNTEVIYSGGYQSDDFYNSPPDASTSLTYMVPDYGYGLGHIYNRSATDDTYNPYPSKYNINSPNEFKVGAPFHFYFGLKRGKSSLNRFIKKYIEL